MDPNARGSDPTLAPSGRHRGFIHRLRSSRELRRTNQRLTDALVDARNAAERYRSLIDHLPNTMAAIYDRRFQVMAATKNGYQAVGLGEDGVIGRTPEQIMDPGDAAAIRSYLSSAFSGRSITIEHHSQTLGVAGRLEVVPVANTKGQPDEVMVVFRDIRVAPLVPASDTYLATLLEHGSDVLVVTDRQLAIRYTSPAFARVFGATPSSFADDDRSLTTAFHPEDRHRVVAALTGLVGDPDAPKSFVGRVAAGSETRTVEVTASNRLSDPQLRGLVWTCRDISERVAVTARLTHQAMHDSLTNLPNRALLVDRLTQALARSERSGSSCALIFIDLDHFKRVNDTLGHEAGDELLVLAGQRLRATIRPGDSVARFGGDEFAVLAEDIRLVDDALRLAERIRRALIRPIELVERTVTVDCTMGIALSKDHRPEALLQEADTALHRAKENGRGRWELYDDGMRAIVQRRLDTEEMIRTAIHAKALAVAYQPIVDLVSGLVTGTEALARIRDADGSVILPADFISVAEDCGLIVPLGAAILDEACGQQASWAANGELYAQVSVNVSPRQLSSGSLVDGVRRTLELRELEPNQLCLELTESALIDVGAVTRRTIDELKAMGVKLALDDFGTGWSSLAYLRQFPIDIVKIDRSFIAGLGTNEADTEVVRAVIGLGQALHLRTVAEGVETLIQEELLKDLGCDFAQGFRYGRPEFVTD